MHVKYRLYFKQVLAVSLRTLFSKKNNIFLVGGNNLLQRATSLMEIGSVNTGFCCSLLEFTKNAVALLTFSFFVRVVCFFCLFQKRGKSGLGWGRWES